MRQSNENYKSEHAGNLQYKLENAGNPADQTASAKEETE